MLEEAKKWAATIVERLRMRWLQAGAASSAEEPDFQRLKQVLDEMIETIAVLERLCFLAAKAGLFTFDLRKLLDDYLGDVQVVAEFEDQRTKILRAFRNTLTNVHKAFPNADIFVIAHSEGTVVSFLGLLDACRNPEAQPWIRKVSGYMTFGSPLDKHLILWPNLFGSAPPLLAPERPIEWRNYYDKGDPIGFALDDVRWWLGKNGWDHVFHFTGEEDIGFIRYPFPGKAHVDYWNDRGVFRHFISTVVGEHPAPKEPKSDGRARPRNQAKPPTPTTVAPADDRPRDILWTKWLSYLIPYCGVGALFFLALYVLFKTVTAYTRPDDAATYPTGFILAHVAALAILLFGVTVTSRIPRLTRVRSWRLFAWFVFLLSAAVYIRVLPEGNPNVLRIGDLDLTIPTGWSRLAAAILIVGIVYVISGRWPSLGLKPLLFVGGAIITGLVVYQALTTTEDKGRIWPVFLGVAGFFYLWWLAALIFDLVFVWHVYIRQALGLRRMDDWVGYPARAEGASEAMKIATAQRSIGFSLPWSKRGPVMAPGGGSGP